MIRCKLVEYTNPDASQTQARMDRAVAGEVLGIGRAASCRIYLPDPRVRLEHAAIRRAEDGYLYLDAAGPVFVNQRAQTNVRLAVGQKITIGPYDFIVDSLEDGPGQPGARLTLSFALRAGAGDAPTQVQNEALGGLRPAWINRRRLAWLLSLVMLVVAGLPVWHAYHPPDQPLPFATAPGWQTEAVHWVRANTARLDTFWNPGPVSSAHQTFANDCRSCHDQPFARVADTACASCHKTTGTHVADRRLDQAAFQGQRCASCHKEHQGAAGMRTVDAVGCAQCHGNLRAYAPQSTLPDVSDFGRQHPPFRLSVRLPGEPPQVQRVAQTPALRNDTGLKFPHDIHLARAGIQSPTGPASTGGRVVLECANCHRPDASGARFEPVRMARDCQGCHRLSVDPQAPEREVPHAPVAEVAVAVREVYAALAVDRIPVSLVTVNSLLQRPQAQPAPAVTMSAGRFVQQQSERALFSMMEGPQGVCKTCHQVDRLAGGTRAGGGTPALPAWQVRPIVSTDHWLPKSRFSHVQHQNARCTDCHDAAGSKSAADILIPDLASCRTCHAGPKAEAPRVASGCDSCHGFHAKVAHPAFGKTAAAKGAP
ncbi:MAG: cytochrome c3 family protein [Rhodoferax sp.]|jgi:hypothetical protein